MEKTRELVRQMTFLTQEQSDAIYSESPLTLVKAGAGAGKTLVICQRAIHLGTIHPDRCVILTTFTREAAKEIRKRIARIAQESGTPQDVIDRIHVATLGSLVFATAKKAQPGLRVANSIKPALRHVFSVMGRTRITLSPSVRRTHEISRKRRAYTDDEYIETLREAIANTIANGRLPHHKNGTYPWITEAYTLYVAYLHERGQASLSMLQLIARDALYRDPEVCGLGHGGQYDVLVDEAQDCCFAQYEVARFLSMRGSLTLVGDDAQGIYGWRGSLENFMSFDAIRLTTIALDRDIVSYKKSDIKVVRLTKNFRSSANIITSACAVIDAMVHKLKDADFRLGAQQARQSCQMTSHKTETGHTDDTQIRVRSYKNKDEEANAIVSGILKNKRDYVHLDYADIAVIARTHGALAEIEAVLRNRNVPFIHIGSPFYQLKGFLFLKNIILFCERYLSQVGDIKSVIEQIASVSIGSITLPESNAQATTHSTRMTEQLKDYLSAIEECDAPLALRFRRLIAYLDATPDTTYSDFIRLAYTELCGDALKDENPPYLLPCLLSIAHDHDLYGENITLSRALTFMEEEETGVRVPGYVTLATPFGVKGLEFHSVFLARCQSGTFPSARVESDETGYDSAIDFRDDVLKRSTMSAEAKVFFVALTRAKEYLCITHVTNEGEISRTGKGARLTRRSLFIDCMVTATREHIARGGRVAPVMTYGK